MGAVPIHGLAVVGAIRLAVGVVNVHHHRKLNLSNTREKSFA
jgi:hypothetical protein